MFFNGKRYGSKVTDQVKDELHSPRPIEQQSLISPNSKSKRPVSAMQTYKLDLKQKQKMLSLKQQDLGNQVLQFSQKQYHNRLKSRHKKYVYSDQQKHNNNLNYQCISKLNSHIIHRSPNATTNKQSNSHFETDEISEFQTQTQKNQQHFETVKRNISSLSIPIEQPQNSIVLAPTVFQKFLNSPQLTQCQTAGPSFTGQQKGNNGKKTPIQQTKIENNSCEFKNVQISTTAKPLKIHHNKSIHQQGPSPNSIAILTTQTHQNPIENYNNYNDVYTFKKIKKRKNSIMNINTITKEHAQSHTTEHEKCFEKPKNQKYADSEDTVCNSRIPTVKTVQQRQKMIKIPIIPIRNHSSHNRRFSMNYKPNSTKVNRFYNISDQPTQSVQQQSQPSSTSSSQSSYTNIEQSHHQKQALSERVGIVKTPSITISINNEVPVNKITKQSKNRHKHNKTYENNIDKIQDINEELQLDMKIIDDSFEISSFDYNQHDIAAFDNNIFISPGVSTTTINQHNNHTLPPKLWHKQSIILEQSIISPQCQKLRSKLDSMLDSKKKKRNNGKCVGCWTNAENIDYFEDNSNDKKNIGINIGGRKLQQGQLSYTQQLLRQQQQLSLSQLQEQQQQQSQQQEEEEEEKEENQEKRQQDEQTELNTFINNTNINQSQNNILFHLNLLHFNDSISYKDEPQQQSQCYFISNSHKQTNSSNSLKISTVSLSLENQTLQMDQKTGLLLHKTTFLIKNGTDTDNLVQNKINAVLKNLLNLSTNHHAYLKHYKYKLQKNEVVLYKQPILLTKGIYRNIYNIKDIENKISDVEIGINIGDVRNIIKQLLSIICSNSNSFCKDGEFQQQYLKLRMEDIYLCAYDKCGYDIRIDKSKAMLFSLLNRLSKRINSKETIKRNILRQNLTLLSDIIKLLQKLAAKNNDSSNLCVNKIFINFIQLLESTIGSSEHKINIQNILTHPYIWSQLPKSNSGQQFNAFAHSYQQLSVIY